MAIQSTYITELATKFQTDIANAYINDSILISSFSVESVSTNVYEIQFGVTSAQTALITNIKLRKSDNTVIVDNDVNIPITSDEIIVRETITINEI